MQETVYSDLATAWHIESVHTAAMSLQTLLGPPRYACRRLLARLCIAREEIAEVVTEQHSKRWQSGSTEELYASNLSLKNQGIPKASLAFLKELLNMSDKDKR